MSKSFKIDLTGQCFGRLTVLEFVPNEKRKTSWLCRCNCGNLLTVIGRDLRRGHTLSCGCFQREQAVKCNAKHNYKHTRLYSIWCGMKTRCSNPNEESYKYYGGRGITICDEWKNSFTSFRDWAISVGYSDELTIDRIEVNGNYEPNNCRWVGRNVQSKNTRRNIIVKYCGGNMCLADVAEKLDIKRATLIFSI